ncbi:glycosyltransferase family 1 protein [Parathielavia appendiculata]|uniref:Glycosyltransferase family 1 protein n=1 Tax=Parathielavia appendiculata TaxID=2587402 RepID=A0AAN6TQI9_9PEZI|nr:glycosyltransferase family 1 protein [Parathielavia appendiculata]
MGYETRKQSRPPFFIRNSFRRVYTCPTLSRSESIMKEPVEDSAWATGDGRVDINLGSRLCRTLSLLVPPESTPNFTPAKPRLDIPPPPEYTEEGPQSIRLNIVIQVVGSRGDVQPFVALGMELRRHGHRVRLATHDTFCDFVRSSGLEFFPVGGDPAELMAYMVKNPGLMPSMRSLRAGDVHKKRKMVAEMLGGFWRSCVEPDPATHTPFVAEAIIANPPSFAHVHCAQALGVPLHLMFTMPWTSTRRFCHPLANLKGNEDLGIPREVANHVSFKAVEWLTWQGLGDIINKWRETLDLQPVPFSEGPGLAETLQVPFTYCWSPALVPKPDDWPAHIDVCGFFFRDPPSFNPDPELAKFLDAGTPPIYIGFGSIVIDDAEALTNTLLEAVRSTGVRAIISRGWSKLGGNRTLDLGANVFYLGDCPHEWLFQRVSAVIHHGGAGTTACGLLNGRPTVVVPFFGDQPFWGDMVAAAGAGPSPIPQKKLNATNLAEAIRFCLSPEASDAARRMARQMRSENGVARAVASFHANLPLEKMRCDVMPHLVAAWSLKTKRRRRPVKISKEVAEILVAEEKVKPHNLKRYQIKPIHIDLKRWDPVTAAASSLAVTSAAMVTSAADIVVKPIQAFTRPPRSRPATAEGHHGGADPHHSRNPSPLPTTHHQKNDFAEKLMIYGRPAALELPPPENSTTYQTKEEKEEQSRTTTAFLGCASGVGNFFKHWTKGMYLDMPLAVSEGLRNAPRLYGGDVYDPGRVTDWKSGGAAAGKNFVHGLVEGFGGLVVKPVQGARKEGALGAAKGAGVGLLNMGTKVSSGVLGLAALSGQGLYLSGRSLVHKDTRKMVREATRDEGRYAWGVGRGKGLEVDRRVVVEAFDLLVQGQGDSVL